MTISEIINCIRDTRNDEHSEHAIKRLRRNPKYFLDLPVSDDWPTLGRRIFKDMVSAAEPLLRRKLHDIEIESYGEQAAIIAQAKWSLEQERLTETLQTPVVKTQQKRGAVDRATAFAGLSKPKNAMPDHYYRELNELQEICLRLKYDYSLSDERIAGRVNRAKSTVQGILKTAKNMVQRRAISRNQEKNRK
jgi:hypothetical protein